MAVLLGQPAAGSAGDSISPPTDAAGFPFVASVSGDVDTLWMRKKAADASLTGITLGLYANDSLRGRPGALLSSAAAGVGFDGAAAFSAALPAPVPVVAGSAYWLALTGVGGAGIAWLGSPGPWYQLSAGTVGLPPNWPGDRSQSGPWTNVPEIWAEGTSKPYRRERGLVFADAAGTSLANTQSLVGAYWEGGFLRSPGGLLVTSPGPGTPQRGFIRDANGALVVVAGQSTPKLYPFA